MTQLICKKNLDDNGKPLPPVYKNKSARRMDQWKGKLVIYFFYMARCLTPRTLIAHSHRCHKLRSLSPGGNPAQHATCPPFIHPNVPNTTHACARTDTVLHCHDRDRLLFLAALRQNGRRAWHYLRDARRDGFRNAWLLRRADYRTSSCIFSDCNDPTRRKQTCRLQLAQLYGKPPERSLTVQLTSRMARVVPLLYFRHP